MQATCGQGHRWNQRGNETGHCANCHRNFMSDEAFVWHQRIKDGKTHCVDPAVEMNKNGTPKFEPVFDGLTTYWRRYRRQDGTMAT